MTKVSVVIRTYNEEKWIGTCLDRVFSQEFEDEFEVIIVDSESNDKTIDIAKEYKVKILTLPKMDFSFGKGINYGIANSKGEYIILISAHAIPTTNQWMTYLTQDFQDPKVAGVYGKQLPLPNCNPMDARDLLNCYGNKRKIQTKDYFFSNANSAIRRSVWEIIPFDEKVNGAEDAYWARDVQAKGYKIVYEPKAAVMHSHNESLKKVYKRAYREALELKKLNNSKQSILSIPLSTGYNTLKDWIFILKNKRSLKWFIIAPVDRFVRSLGYYKGYKD